MRVSSPIPIFVKIKHFIFRHSNACTVVSHCYLFCISLMNYDVEYLHGFQFLHPYTYSLMKHHSYFNPFIIGLYILLLFNCDSVFYILDTKKFISYVISKYFLPIWGFFFFHFLQRIFQREKFLNLMETKQSFLNFF